MAVTSAGRLPAKYVFHAGILVSLRSLPRPSPSSPSYRSIHFVIIRSSSISNRTLISLGNSIVGPTWHGGREGEELILGSPLISSI